MADDEGKLLDAARKAPWDERLTHKNWKARVEAYSDVAKFASTSFDAAHPALKEFGATAHKVCADSNANAQLKGLETLLVFLQHTADEAYAAKYAPPITAAMVSKCLGQRPTTVKAATDCCLALTELEAAETVVTELLKGLGNKVPKVVLAAVDTLLAMVTSFGVPTVPPKPILKALPAAFAHKDATVRERAKELTVELSRWVGLPVVGQLLLDKMTDAMKADVQKKLDDAPPGKATADRFTRQVAAARAARPAAAPSGAAEGAEGAAVEQAQDDTTSAGAMMDTYELAEPVEILSKLDKAHGENPPFWSGIKDTKWSLRRDALKELQNLADTPRLAPGEFHELSRTLKKLVQNDSNVVVVGDAIQAAALLCKGLRASYREPARLMTAVVLDKFKDKQSIVVKNCHQCLLNFVLYSLTLTEMVDDVLPALAHKVPKVKEQTCRWLEAAVPLLGGRDAVGPTLKPLMPTLVKTCEDADGGVRTAAIAAIAAFARAGGGLQFVGRYIEPLDDKKKKALVEAVGSGGNNAASQPAGVRSPQAKAAAAAAKNPKAPTAALKDSNGVRTSVAAAGGKKPAVGAGAGGRRPATAPAKRGGGGGGSLKHDAAGEQENLSGPSRSKEEIHEAMEALAGPSTVTQVLSDNWKERLEGVEALATLVAELGDSARSPHDDTLVCFIAPMVVKEKNLQVQVKMVEILAATATAADTFSRRMVHQCLEGVATLLGGHIRGRAPAGDCLTAFTEAVGPAFVFKNLPKVAASCTNPKILQESLTWMAAAMEEFGVKGVDMKALVSTTKEALDSAVPATRTAATKLLGVMHTFVGPPMLASYGEVKPALLKLLEDECKRMGFDAGKSSAPPARSVRKPSDAGSATGAVPTAAAAIKYSVHDLDDTDGPCSPVSPEQTRDGGIRPPPEDISGLITSQLLAEMGGSDWKARAAALEAVEGMLRDASHSVGPDVGDLFASLKARLTDTNKNLVAHAVTVLGAVAAAMGGPCERQTRGYMEDIFKCLSDNKPQVRDACIKSLDAWAGAVGADKVAAHLTTALAQPKASEAAKVAGLGWLAEEAVRAADVVVLVKAAGAACADKSSKVKVAGTALFEALIQHRGSPDVHVGLKPLPSALRKTVDPVLLKLGLGAPGPSSSATFASSAAAVPAKRPATARSAVSKSITQLPSKTRPASAAPVRQSAAVSSFAAAKAEKATPSGGCILLPNGDKEKRARKEGRGLKTFYEEPRPDAGEELERSFGPFVTEEQHVNVFSTDFRKLAAAAEALTASVAVDLEAAIDNLDLLFRWLVLRMVEANTTSLLKSFELLDKLLEALRGVGYRLSETEAALLLPTLLDKSGHNIVQVRDKYRAMMRAVCGVYPPAKVLGTFLVEAFHSKNNRSRIECMEECAAMIERHGVEHTKGARALPALVELVGSKETAIRQTALNCLASVYRHVGADVWPMLGKCSDVKIKDTIDEKFKWTLRQMEKDGEGRPGDNYHPSTATSTVQSSAAHTPGRASPRHPKAAPAAAYPSGAPPAPITSLSPPVSPTQRSFPPTAHNIPPNLRTSLVSALNGGAQQRPGSAPAQRAPPEGLQDSRINPQLMAAPTPSHGPRPQSAAGGVPGTPSSAPWFRNDEELARAWQRALAQVAEADEGASVDGMKAACTMLAEPAGGRVATSTVAQFVADADRLVVLLTAKSRQVFASSLAQVGARAGTAPGSRACKYVLNTLMQAFQLPALARAVAESTLRELTGELLYRLLDDRIPRLEEGTSLLKALNILMLKILENSRRNYSFSSLLHLLRTPPPVVAAEAAAGGGGVPTKFSDLVVKCLIKLTKALGAALGEVDLDMLLLSIHQFFMGLGVDEIRRRGQEDDKPLRMVKTVLHEVCKLKGAAIREHLSLIPRGGVGAEPVPIIHAYIDLNLQSLSSTTSTSTTSTVAPVATVGATTAAAPAEKETRPATPARLLRASSNGSGGSGSGSGAGLSTPTATLRGAGESSTSPGSAGGVVAARVMVGSPPTDLKQELASIFKKIGDKDSTSAGLEALYHFTRSHPAIDITPHLSKTSEAFRIYIKRGLEKVEQQYTSNSTNAATFAATSAASPVAAAMTTTTTQEGSHTTDGATTTQQANSGGMRQSYTSLDAIKERMEKINQSVRASAASGVGGAGSTAPPTLRASVAAMPFAANPAPAAPVPAPAAAAAKPATSLSMAELKERMARLQAAKLG